MRGTGGAAKRGREGFQVEQADEAEAEVGDSHECLGKEPLLRLRISKLVKASHKMKAEKKSKAKIVQRLTLKKMQKHNSQSQTLMLVSH